MKPAFIRNIEIIPVTFSLRAAFVTAAGHKTETHNIQVRIHLSDGTIGLGEGSSSIAMPSESQVAMGRAIKSLIPEIRSKAIDEYRELIATCWRLQGLHPTATAAVECAILDAYTKRRNQSLATFFGGKKNFVDTDMTLSVGEPDALHKAAKDAVKKGFRRLKVKMASDHVDQNVARLQAVHAAAPKAELVADGNQGQTLSQALEFSRRLQRAQISLVFLEQPFRAHDLRSMRIFKSKSRVPLLADESVRTAADALKLFDANAADGVNIKVAKSGLLGALDIIRIAQRANKSLSIGCMEESKLGLAASVHLACGTGVFEWVDLDSVFLLEASRFRGGFQTKGPRLSVNGIRAGIGG